MNTIKSLPLALVLLLLTALAHAQTVKPCDKWLTDFIQVSPKMSDGSCIEKYVVSQLQSNTSLKTQPTCMVGFMVYVNCLGEFSFDEMTYRNNALLQTQCNELLKATEVIMSGIKTLSPGTIRCEKKDFTFKLVVRIKHNGDAVAEVLY